MKITLAINKSVHENAAEYYKKAKEARKKIEGLERAIEETKKEMERAATAAAQRAVRVKKEKKWFEKFNWFFTSQNRLAVGGRSAQQNDQLFLRHMEKEDLFFHADIQGGSAVILKEGTHATEDELKEAAQFAASLSNAWKNANASVDVYCVKHGQVSKHAQSGYVPTGGFAITGERTWFRSTKLGLRVGMGNEGVEIVPIESTRTLKNEVTLFPNKSGKEKGELAKMLAKRLNIHVDDVIGLLPNGRSKVEK